MTSRKTTGGGIAVSPRIASALAAQTPVVAFESTVYSTLGLPEPANREVLARSTQAVQDRGCEPALTAVIDGVPSIGIDDPEPLFGCDKKVAARDLAVAAAQRWPVGVTTVGASLTIADAAGVAVFATGGIGGVHRGAAHTGDVSGDLGVIARYPIVTVCAGAKSFLDLGQTLERLETLGVPVIGWRTDRLPAFTTTDSGLDVPYRCDDVAEIAAMLTHRRALGQGGILVCAPPPAPLDPELLANATEIAEAAADEAGVTGPDRTPFVLAGIAEHTDGRSIAANTALVENNAGLAADIAVAFTASRR